MNLCLRPASCPYRLYPHDTLCTHGVKQLKLLGFSRRYLFCSTRWWTVQDSNPSGGFRVLFFRILPFFFVFTQPAFVPPAAVQVLALPLP